MASPSRSGSRSPDTDGRAISTADFVVPDARVAIYIDGVAFHRGDPLRRDRLIRERLRSGSAGWRVVELPAVDLGRGVTVVEEIGRKSEGRAGGERFELP